MKLTCLVESRARPAASVEVKVLLPTPPFPDKTMILCFTEANRHFTSFTPISTQQEIQSGRQKDVLKTSFRRRRRLEDVFNPFTANDGFIGHPYVK